MTHSSETKLHTTTNRRIERSADPILSRPSGIEELLSSKNVADNLDSNDVEFSGRIAPFIQPSKTLKEYQKMYLQQTSISEFFNSGEVERAPQAKSLSLTEPLEMQPTATTTPNFATQSLQPPKPRQASADIQDIITGIVKLLNGNVNVQANTSPPMGRPLRPVSTRINNRGPPRISDVPILPPDFDAGTPQLPLPPLGPVPPPVGPTKVPTPYPFDFPQNTSPIRPHISLLEQMNRPGMHRPLIPTWSRPNGPSNGSRRPINPYRRPKPPFKPIPIHKPDEGSTTSTEKPNVNSDPELETNFPSDDGDTTTDPDGDDSLEMTTLISTNDAEELDYEKNKEKSSSKMEKHTTRLQSSSEAMSTLSSNSSAVETSSLATVDPTKVAMPSITSTTETNITLTENNTTDSITSIATPTLESSIQEVLQTLKDDLLSSSTISTDLSQISISPTPTLDQLEKFNVTTTATPTLPLETTNTTSQIQPLHSYRPRPGIVLDDTEYKPGGNRRPPIITARPQLGDIFDITVSAIQGPGGSPSRGQGKPYVVPVDIDGIQTGDVITSPVGNEGFVSIDGKRTYLNLFGESTTDASTDTINISPTTSTPVIGTGFAVPQVDIPKQPEHKTTVQPKPTLRRPLYGRRPSQPSVRIDTCIVGDDSTCDRTNNEVCKTELGVSACHCSPGHARRQLRDPCRKIVSMVMSLRVDRLYERRVVWVSDLGNKGSDSYQQLSYETERAMESAMSMTPFSDEFLGIKVNNIYKGDRSASQSGVYVNITLQLEANGDTSRPTVRNDIQRHLLGVIQRRSNNIGNSALWVDSPPGSISSLQDLDECSSPELHDCHSLAVCINVFGGFKCECNEGLKDPWADHKHQAGRHCEQCSSQHCNNRGECKYHNGQEVCTCTGSYYGSQCEVDGEILGVAIGASVAAVVIIGLTLACLIMWSRRWSRDQKAGVGSPVFGYMTNPGSTMKSPVVGGPYHVTMEDRIRWAQIADVMAQSNHYAPEPVPQVTRPSSAMFGYPNLSVIGTMQRGTFHGTLPPVPLPRLGLQAQLAARAASVQGMRPLDNSSSSEEEDKADLLGRNFHVPRPKSRSNASIANQSGIYYDVDYEQNDIYKQGTGIPMSTYAVGRPYYRS
ncbi:proteoglycan 4 isoform X2 [Photinus pyralis]|nr:proteoglycan 4 isoform X2 [Photinus pyralis]